MAASESALTGRGAQADLSMLANMPDDIGAAHQQMMRFFKLYADTIWEVQQMKQYDSQKVGWPVSPLMQVDVSKRQSFDLLCSPAPWLPRRLTAG